MKIGNRGISMKTFNIKKLLIMMIDLGLIYYAFFFSSLLLHDFNLNIPEMQLVISSLIWILPLYMIHFVLFRLYDAIWEFASIEEAINVLFSLSTSFIFLGLFIALFKIDLSINLLILAQIILFLSLIGVRFSYRLLNIVNNYLVNDKGSIRTLVIGAGSAGSLLIKEMKVNKTIQNKVVCLVDDDARKFGKVIQGVQVVGGTYQLKYLVFKYKIDEVIVSIPSASKIEFQQILTRCEDLKIEVKIFPPFYKLIDKSFSLDKIRNVEIEDLLGRDEIELDNNGLHMLLSNEVVFVSGGGGSIGSEICRQILKYSPQRIIIFDQYENNAYDIQNELHMQINKLKLNVEILVLIGSVQDEYRLKEIFNLYPITVVFHAAAHKHVPLMEDCPKEAIKNNVFGTYLLAKLSNKHNVKKFVLISSDKAVNPTNIMGATKRLAEMIIKAFDEASSTQYSAVRFGNVLGSNGSVIPLFKKQIEEGGPVTVTHKEIIRYFMTIHEAVSLVLQAGAYSNGGEIFVLDMGEPVKILELAEKLIRLSGYEPYHDIDIAITGLRPGDKLYEELLTNDENLGRTSNEKIFVLNQKEVSLDKIEEMLEELHYLVSLTHVNIKEEIAKYIPTYKQMKEGIL